MKQIISSLLHQNKTNKPKNTHSKIKQMSYLFFGDLGTIHRLQSFFNTFFIILVLSEQFNYAGKNASVVMTNS